MALIGLVQLGFSLPALLFGEDAGLPVHTARHRGPSASPSASVCSWRRGSPKRSPASSRSRRRSSGASIVTSILDVTTAHVPPSGELNHVTKVVGLVSLWLLSRTPGAQRRDAWIAPSCSRHDAAQAPRRGVRDGSGLVVLWATPAFVHAVLLQTTPGAGRS